MLPTIVADSFRDRNPSASVDFRRTGDRNGGDDNRSNHRGSSRRRRPSSNSGKVKVNRSLALSARLSAFAVRVRSSVRRLLPRQSSHFALTDSKLGVCPPRVLRPPACLSAVCGMERGREDSQNGEKMRGSPLPRVVFAQVKQSTSFAILDFSFRAKR